MAGAIQFAVIGIAILGSISLALALEWLSLWGLMKLMPATQPRPRQEKRVSRAANLLEFNRAAR